MIYQIWASLQKSGFFGIGIGPEFMILYFCKWLSVKILEWELFAYLILPRVLVSWLALNFRGKILDCDLFESIFIVHLEIKLHQFLISWLDLWLRVYKFKWVELNFLLTPPWFDLHLRYDHFLHLWHNKIDTIKAAALFGVWRCFAASAMLAQGRLSSTNDERLDLAQPLLGNAHF